MWDTGSHVSALSEEFLAHSFSEAQVRNISELIKGDLSLSAANGSEIPYKGWTEVRFQNKTPQSQDLIVPFLVSPETADYPLLGYNVIEEAVKLDPDVARPELLRESFPTIADDQLESLVNFIKSKHSDTELCSVRSDKNDAVVPKGTSAAISCPVNHGPIDKRTPFLFEPDELALWPDHAGDSLVTKAWKTSRIKTEMINTTNHDIILPNRTSLGQLQLVQSVTPVEVKLKEKVESPLEGGSSILEANINLKDTTPVQKNYVAVPRPLYPEVKSHIEDLLNCKFIKKSTSPYSSPAVCVRKRTKVFVSALTTEPSMKRLHFLGGLCLQMDTNRILPAQSQSETSRKQHPKQLATSGS